MKLLSVILVLMIAAQPVQAGFCDMGPSDGAAQQAPMQNDEQHDGHRDGQRGMQHDQQHGSGAQASGHDCCDAQGSRPDQDCDGFSHCATCIAGLAALPVQDGPAAALHYAYRLPLTEGQVPPSHTSPPYRPPTAIS